MVIRTITIRIMIIASSLIVLRRSCAEVYTSVSDLESLLDTQKIVIDALNFYIQKEESKLKTLKKHLNHFVKEHEKAMDNVPNYLGNPIKAYSLIKRLTIDFNLINDIINNKQEFIKHITITDNDVIYPTMEDLRGAAQALSRLQKVYLLNIQQLSEGLFNNDIRRTPMRADECFELGKALYNDRDYNNALNWMAEALRKFQVADDEMYSITEVDILEYIGYTHHLLGNTKTALEWMERLLTVEPMHVNAQSNVTHFITLQEKGNRLGKRGAARFTHVTNEDQLYRDTWSSAEEWDAYESLCRGEIVISNEVSKRLKCWYTSEHHPFLKYAPIKTEQAYIKPDVFLFHEVLSDVEIEYVKSVAKPRFQRAQVYGEAGKGTHTSNRISKSAWLKDEESPCIARISQRVADMTGLSMLYAEPLHVVNYGIGGHYAPHYDFSWVKTKDDAFTTKKGGQRIATVLFYMSDVELGGSTVFMNLGLSLPPVKSAAAFWLNLHPSGDSNTATKHAACPVLQGTKWVSNKWMHEGGQEFIKPCGLHHRLDGLEPPSLSMELH